MSGGQKAAATQKAKYGADHFSRIAKLNKAERHFARLKRENPDKLRQFSLKGNNRKAKNEN